MASEATDAVRAEATALGITRRLRATVALAAMLLVGCAVLASHASEQPRVLVLCALSALAAMAWGGRALGRLRYVWQALPVELPTPASEAWQALQQRALQHETWLEHAPVALWLVTGSSVAPLNTAARRLLAPGRAQSAAALHESLRNAAKTSHGVLRFASEHGEERALLARSTVWMAGGETQILALLPIESALEAEALQAWRQLVHVLTHEIMNSLTPIASLSRTAQEMLSEEGADVPPALALALETIARRAAHLASFVDSYRSLSRLPAPKLAPLCMHTLMARLEQLVAAEWAARGGIARFHVAPAAVELLADADQLEQALLNLLRNAAEATAGLARPEVEVCVRLGRGARLLIEVLDNGPGVAAGLEGAIFTPFFTTKAQGLGVGLALVRQIAHGMGGSLRYAQRPGGGACFRLSF